MPQTTANTLITTGLQMLGILDPEDTMSAAQARIGLRALNLMMGLWSLTPTTSPVTAREVFALTANVQTYSIGPGGDFDTTRPNSLIGAGLLLGNSNPIIEIPRAVITNDAWQLIQVKTLANTLFTEVYYNATYSSDWGEISLWPVPNTSQNQLVIYRSAQLALFPSLAATVDLPEGTEEPIQMNVTVRLGPYFDETASQDIKDMARNGLAAMLRNNLPLSDLPTDAAITNNRSGAYNIMTGSGGGA